MRTLTFLVTNTVRLSLTLSIYHFFSRCFNKMFYILIDVVICFTACSSYIMDYYRNTIINLSRWCTRYIVPPILSTENSCSYFSLYIKWQHLDYIVINMSHSHRGGNHARKWSTGGRLVLAIKTNKIKESAIKWNFFTFLWNYCQHKVDHLNTSLASIFICHN